MLFLLVAVALIGVAVHQLLEAASFRRRQTMEALARASHYGGSSLREEQSGPGVGDRLVGPSVRRLAGLAMRMTPRSSPDAVGRRLAAAGLGHVSTTSYLAVKGGVAAGLVALGLLMRLAGAPTLTAFLVAGIGGFAARSGPDFLLSKRTTKRKQALTRQMPDVLDLLTVSVEAGLGFDQALLKVGERMEGPLVEELLVMTHELRIGETRHNALKSFAERLDLTETTSFARAIIQADQMGIALGRVLRVQSQELRYRRQMAAEEKAMKAPVKMLMPVALFIFPAMFVVTLGPAVLSVMASFK